MFSFWMNQAFAGDLPIAGSDVAVRWDSLYNFLFWLSVFFFVLIVGAMILFAVQYKDRPGLRARYIPGNHLLEAIWVVIPTVLLMVIFGWGWSVYRSMTQPPSNALEVRVIGKQWLWTFQYDNGRVTVGDLFVPVNRPVKLIMTSEDVIHSFFVPNFRIKQDVVPGMYTSVWFEAKITGKHQIYCAEFCGTSHSGMLGKVVVLHEQQWKDWNGGKKLPPIPDAGKELTAADIAAENAQATLPLAEQGQRIYQSKGCAACHSPDGSSKVGPTFKGLFGARVDLADGTTETADENFLRESIEKPQAKIAKGYQPVMPTFQGLLSETEMNALLAYIKSLK